MIPMKQKAIQYLKNSFGWSTKRRIIVFSVDDYGNIRIASEEARRNLKRAGLPLDGNRFDQYDTLETKDDLTHLFEVLNSVNDEHGRPAVFTPFSLPANIDFDRMAEEGFVRYQYELLPDTLRKLPGHEGTWELWEEGMSKDFFVPQFHGREHVNLAFLNEMVRTKNPLFLACMKERSWAGLQGLGRSKSVSYVSAFSFEELEENESLSQIAIDGLAAFRKVFRFSASHFNAPGSPAHAVLEKALADGGIKYVDTSFVKKEHQGGQRYRYRVAFQGQKNKHGQHYIIRNCVFEPLLYKTSDAVARTLGEIEVAFRLNKPAIISSHRVNFCGLIDPAVRDHGLRELQRLLNAIIAKWPNVEFMASHELGALMTNVISNSE